MPIAPVSLDLAALVSDALDEQRAVAERYRVSVAPDAPVPVVGDHGLLARVVGNLVTNALQFSPRGGAVHIALEPGADHVRFSITDEGPGVPEASRTRIFEKFGTLGPRRTRHSTGLGLSFCKLAIEAHGGTIGVEPGTGGSGSTFWFTLPIGVASDAEGTCTSR
jgi:signal transduction histidine kinase